MHMLELLRIFPLRHSSRKTLLHAKKNVVYGHCKFCIENLSGNSKNSMKKKALGKTGLVKLLAKLYLLESHIVYHRATELLRLEGTNNAAQGRSSQGKLPRTMPRQVLCISRDGDSTAPLGNLC